MARSLETFGVDFLRIIVLFYASYCYCHILARGMCFKLLACLEPEEAASGSNRACSVYRECYFGI